MEQVRIPGTVNFIEDRSLGQLILTNSYICAQLLRDTYSCDRF